jgi:hypothetical protein
MARKNVGGTADDEQGGAYIFWYDESGIREPQAVAQDIQAWV